MMMAVVLQECTPMALAILVSIYGGHRLLGAHTNRDVAALILLCVCSEREGHQCVQHSGVGKHVGDVCTG